MSDRHLKRNPGEKVRVDRDFTPAFAREPAEVLKVKRSSFLSDTWDYLIEWATQQRSWVSEYAVHDTGWNNKTGEGCPCGLGDNLSRFKIEDV